jgi:hypothetical protein
MDGYQIVSNVLYEYSNPDIKVGDMVLVGRFKNRKAIVKGFTTDKNNQPQVQTSRGTYSLYRFRINKMMPEDKKKKFNETS